MLVYFPLEFYPGLDFPDFQIHGRWIWAGSTSARTLPSWIRNHPTHPLTPFLEVLVLEDYFTLQVWEPGAGLPLRSTPTSICALIRTTPLSRTCSVLSPGSNQLPESWLSSIWTLVQMTLVPAGSVECKLLLLSACFINCPVRINASYLILKPGNCKS